MREIGQEHKGNDVFSAFLRVLYCGKTSRTPGRKKKSPAIPKNHPLSSSLTALRRNRLRLLSGTGTSSAAFAFHPPITRTRKSKAVPLLLCQRKCPSYGGGGGDDSCWKGEKGVFQLECEVWVQANILCVVRGSSL